MYNIEKNQRTNTDGIYGKIFNCFLLIFTQILKLTTYNWAKILVLKKTNIEYSFMYKPIHPYYLYIYIYIMYILLYKTMSSILN